MSGMESPRKLAVQKRDRVARFVVFEHLFFHQPMSVEHGAMVPPAERVANFAEGSFRQFAREVHGDLPWKRDVLRAAFAGHIREANVEVLGDAALDLVNGDGAARLLVEDVLEELLELFHAR